VACVTLIYISLHGLLFVDWEMKLLPEAERLRIKAAKEKLEKLRHEQLEKEIEGDLQRHKRKTLTQKEQEKVNKMTDPHKWDLLKMAGLILLTSIPFFDTISDIAFALGSNLFTIEILYFTILIDLVQFVFFFTHLHDVGAYPHLPIPIPKFAYFEEYDSIFKMFATFFISLPWILVNIPFWLPVLSIGVILWFTGLFLVGRVAVMWLYFWTGKLDQPRIPEFFDMKGYNKHCYIKTLLISTPMLIIKAVNNQQLGNWTTLNFVSVVVSIASLFDTLYRLLYYKIMKKINLEDVPVTMSVFNIDFLVIDPNDPKVHGRLPLIGRPQHPIGHPHYSSNFGDVEGFGGEERKRQQSSSRGRSSTAKGIDDDESFSSPDNVQYHHAHQSSKRGSFSSSTSNTTAVAWTSSPLNNSKTPPNSRLVTRQSLSKQTARGSFSVSATGEGSGFADEETQTKISNIIEEVTMQMVNLKTRIDEVVNDLDEKKFEI